MKELEQTVSQTTHLVSEDGEFRVYVGGYRKDSDEWAEAKRRVKAYEESAIGAMGQIVMAIPHYSMSVESPAAYYFCQDTTMYCDSTVYFFKVSSESEMESIVKWAKLKYTGETVGVALPKPIRGTHEETKDGKKVEVQNDYLTVYDRSCEPAIDLKRFVGHTVVVVENCDYRMYIEGTLEEIKERHETKLKFFNDNVFPKELQ